MVSIKNMKLPDNCWDCELTKETSSGLTLCAITNCALKAMSRINVRDEDCPLMEIEEDFDKLVEDLDKRVQKYEKMRDEALEKKDEEMAKKYMHKLEEVQEILDSMSKQDGR